VGAVRYRHGGKPWKLTLDPYPVLQLPQARERARDALLQVGAGIDPGAAKVAAKRAPEDDGDRDLIENVAEQFLKRHASKNRTAAESRRTLTKDILPRWSGRRVQDITRREVIDLIDGIVDTGHGTKANRVLALVRKFFNWCVERDILKMSPAAGVKPPSPERSRDRILSDDELRWLWKICDEIGEPFGPLVKLLLVTGQRLEEVAADPSDRVACRSSLFLW
jgi:integrase